VYTATTVRSRGVERVVVYRSTDGAATFTPSTVTTLTTGDRGLNHVFLTKDTAGNLYIAWADDPDGTGIRIFFSRSVDHGATWTAPLLVSSATGTHVFPAIDPGTPGRVVVVWYETPTAGDPNALDAAAAWHTHAASTTTGGQKWTTSPVSTVVNHKGILCTKGASCNGHRNLLDFISVEVDAAGRANVVWADDIVTGPDLLYGPVMTYFSRSDAATGKGVKGDL
jgi:hypothetical protein